MVDQDLILKKLGFIETCVQDLQSKSNPQLISSDVREERFVVHGYEKLDLAIVRDIVENQLGDLIDYVANIRSKLT